MPFGREVEVPDVSYTRSGDVSIAYQVVGDGPTDLVVLPFLSNLYTLWQAPKFAEFGYRLAEGRRLIMVNARGVGLSDRPRGFTIESRMDDLRAVMDAVGSERPALLGIAEAAATCAVFAASNPDRVERLILYDPWSQSMLNDREREEALAGVPAQRDRWGRRDVLEQFAVELNPQWADDPDYLDWFVWHHRLTSSPSSWVDFRRMQIDLDVGDALPAIRVPTLVLSKERERPRFRTGCKPHPGCGVRRRSGHRPSDPGESVRSRGGGDVPRRQPCAPDSGHRAGDRPLHRSREFDPARRGARRPRLARACSSGTTSSCGWSSRATGASRSTPPATGSLRASTARRVRSRARARSWSASRSSASRCAPGSTPANASGWGTSSPAWP